MKNSLLQLLGAGALCMITADAQSQVQVSVNVNVGTQPEWGPTGYDRVDYYYLPAIETYYNVPQHQFIYLEAGRWVFAASLPSRCNGYDLYGGYKVVINEPRPWLHHDAYRSRYVEYRECRYRQPVLRDCRRGDDDGPGHGRGRGHAYGHYKKDHGRKHDD